MSEFPIEKPKRSRSITAASILGWVLAGFCLISVPSLFLLAPVWVFAFSHFPEIPFLGTFYPSHGVFIALGVMCLIRGALYVVAGIYLWRCKRRGRILGIAAGTLGIVSSFVPPSELSFIAMLPDIAFITLIAIRWGKLVA